MISIAIHNNAAIKIEKGNIKDPNQKKKKELAMFIITNVDLRGTQIPATEGRAGIP